jgi:hypothetical protein
MNIFVVLVVLLIPGKPGTTDMEQVMFREWITASGQASCQKHADTRADEQRAKKAADVERLRARVVGVCIQHKEPA